AIGGPSDEAWGSEIVQAEPARAGRRGLRKVRGNELQVHRRSEADESVPRPLTDAAAARRCADTNERLEAIDLQVEVASAPDEVIDRRQRRAARPTQIQLERRSIACRAKVETTSVPLSRARAASSARQG